MSFSDQTTVPAIRKLGCAAYFVVSFIVVFNLAIFAVLADCASDDCMADWQRLLLFPGSLILALIGAYFVARWAVQDQK